MNVPIRLVRRSGCLLALLVLAAVAAGTVYDAAAALIPAVTSGADPGSLSVLLTRLAGVVAGTAVTMVGIGGIAVIVTAPAPATSRATASARLAGALAPGWWRRAVLVACGMTLVTPGFATATGPVLDAATVTTAEPESPVSTSCVLAGGLPRPALPTSRDPGDHLVVSPGDSLWRISATRLGPRASDAEVLSLVRRLSRINSQTIGGDPDLIFPGTHLTVPGGTP